MNIMYNIWHGVWINSTVNQHPRDKVRLCYEKSTSCKSTGVVGCPPNFVSLSCGVITFS